MKSLVSAFDHRRPVIVAVPLAMRRAARMHGHGGHGDFHTCSDFSRRNSINQRHRPGQQSGKRET